MFTVLKARWVLLKIVFFTLAISIATLIDTALGRYKREQGDLRLRWWAKKLLDQVQLNYTVENTSDFNFEAGKPYIIMCNHSCLYDIPLIFLSLAGSIRMVAKKELFQIPIWGRGLQVAEFISIDRRNLKQSLKDLAYAKKMMQSGIIIWMAPEGTRSKDGRLLPFKKGGFKLAIETGATILPVGIIGAQNVLPPGTWHVKYNQQVSVHIGQGIDASRYDKKSIRKLMADVEHQIRSLSDNEMDAADEFQINNTAA